MEEDIKIPIDYDHDKNYDDDLVIGYSIDQLKKMIKYEKNPLARLNLQRRLSAQEKRMAQFGGGGHSTKSTKRKKK